MRRSEGIVRRRLARLQAACAAGLIVMTTASCSAFVACPAVGYPMTVNVTLTTPQPGLHLIACIEPECDDAQAYSDDHVSGRSESGWTVNLLLGDALVYRLVDATGDVVAQGTEDELEWTRVGGTEQCGGPQEASVAVDL